MDHTNTCVVFERLSDLPADLIKRMSYRIGDDFFSSLDWFSCLVHHGFSDAPALHLLVASDEKRNENSAPLVCLLKDVDRKRLASLTNYYTIQFPAIFGLKRSSIRITNAIVKVIRDERPAWSEIQLGYLAADDPAISTLRSTFTSAGYHVDVSHHQWNWHIKVDGITYSEYFATRPAHLRNTLRRKMRQVNRNYRLRFRIVSQSDDLSTALTDYLHVYERSWKPREVPPNFVPELIRVCARLGILRLGLLYINDAVVATQFWICSGRISYIYKLAHDPDYNGLSVGSLLTAHMFQHAIDTDRVSEIDFGVGDEPYKQNWTDMRRQRIGLHVINPRTRRGFSIRLRLAVRDILRKTGLRRYTPVTLECNDSNHELA